MNEKWLRWTLAVTVPITFTLVLIGAAFRDRQVNEAIAGGLIAVLGAIVALFATRNGGKNDDEDV
jgi:hypothetical protein